MSIHEAFLNELHAYTECLVQPEFPQLATSLQVYRLGCVWCLYSALLADTIFTSLLPLPLYLIICSPSFLVDLHIAY